MPLMIQCSACRLFPIVFLTVAAQSPLVQTAPADELQSEYVAAMRAQGFPDLAIVYLQRQLARTGLTEAERADLEFQIASSLSDESDLLGDLSKKRDKLDEAKAKFEEFVKKYPNQNPIQRGDALANMALIDLRQGRLKIVMAQLPANAGQAVGLANEARALFNKSASDYELAYKTLLAEYEKMPKFIPDETREDRALRKRKEKLFDQYIEAEFQSALARFWLADSYVSIEIPPPDDPKDEQAKAEYDKRKAQWTKRFGETMTDARKGFDEIFNRHRRELVGLYGDLWRARCMAAQGDHRRAMGIFEQLLEHEDPNLAPFQRDVFYFRTLSFAARKEYDQIRNTCELWLRSNNRYRRETAGLGVQLELARAYVELGKAAKDDGEKNKCFSDAHRLYDQVASTQNEFTGLARKEQLQLSALMNRGVTARSFSQLFSLANAELDRVKPGMSPDEQAATLHKVKELLQQALEAGRETTELESLNEARMALAYAHLLNNDYYEAAILGEFVTRNFPKSASAPQGASFAVTAFAWAYEASIELKSKGEPVRPEVDANHLRSSAAYLFEKWPDSKEANDARMTLGRLEFMLKNYAAAAAALDKVTDKSTEYAEALNLAGRVYWEWYRAESGRENGDAAQLKSLRDRSLERLVKASPLLKQSRAGAIDQLYFLNEYLVGEANFDAGSDDAAITALAPLVAAVGAGSLPDSVEPALRTAALLTTLQCYVRQNKIAETEPLVELITKQRGNEGEGSVTQVFLGLAVKIKEQMERLEAAKETERLAQTKASFDAFLSRVADRKEGQTISSRVYLGESFLGLGNFAKATELLGAALDDPAANESDNANLILRAKMLLARSHRLAGDLEAAKKQIDAVYAANQGQIELILERGEILDAMTEAGGDPVKSIVHWKDAIKRMNNSRPRPDAFFTVMDRLMQIFKKAKGEDRKNRASEGYRLASFLIEVEPQNTPDEWKPVFEKHLADFRAILGIKPAGN